VVEPRRALEKTGTRSPLREDGASCALMPSRFPNHQGRSRGSSQARSRQRHTAMPRSSKLDRRLAQRRAFLHYSGGHAGAPQTRRTAVAATRAAKRSRRLPARLRLLRGSVSASQRSIMRKRVSRSLKADPLRSGVGEVDHSRIFKLRLCPKSSATSSRTTLHLAHSELWTTATR